jgi:hypothetical protein
VRAYTTDIETFSKRYTAWCMNYSIHAVRWKVRHFERWGYHPTLDTLGADLLPGDQYLHFNPHTVQAALCIHTSVARRAQNPLAYHLRLPPALVKAGDPPKKVENSGQKKGKTKRVGPGAPHVFRAVATAGRGLLS